LEIYTPGKNTPGNIPPRKNISQKCLLLGKILSKIKSVSNYTNLA